MAIRGVDPTHFWGHRRPPLTRGELARRPPIVASTKPPESFSRLSSTRTQYVSTSPNDKPSINLTKAAEDNSSTIWKVDVECHGREQSGHLPGRAGHRSRIEEICSAIDPDVSVGGHRPDWLHMLHTPAIVPSELGPRLRRLNGRKMKPLYIFRGDRQPYQDTSYPWGCVGRIVNNEGKAGSGALVGRNIVVTAGHVVPWASVYAGNWSMLFVPDYFDGSSLFGAGIQSYVSDVRGYDSQGNVAGYDYAVLKLYTPVGDQAGYFGFNGYSDDWEGGNYWDVLGYPGGIAGGQRPSWEGSVDIHDDDEDATGGQELESNFCDITGGNSGGPIFGWWPDWPKVIGVVSGQEEEYVFPTTADDNNIFASGPAFTNLIAWARSNW